MRAGNWLGVLSGLWRCGLVCMATGRYAEAVTVWAAYAALTQDAGLPDVTPEEARRTALREAWQVLGAARARAAEDRGAAMSLAAAAEYALILTDLGPQQPHAPGAGKLSARERELVTLVARGRTDAADRRPAVHQHPHRPLAPGPDPGQDRLPPPRRPDPPGPEPKACSSPAARPRRCG